MSKRKSNGWKSIKSAPVDGTKIDLWMDIYASPMSFGMSDAFAVENCWFDAGKWVHMHRGEPTELQIWYITKWRPIEKRDGTTETHSG